MNQGTFVGGQRRQTAYKYGVGEDEDEDEVLLRQYDDWSETGHSYQKLMKELDKTHPRTDTLDFHG